MGDDLGGRVGRLRGAGSAAVTALFEITASDVADTSDDWYTPRWIFNSSGLTFDMDVCAPIAPEFRTCPAARYLTPVEDGLSQPWEGLVWMNPPYSGPSRWVSRWAAHPDGLALLPTAKSLWMRELLAAAEEITLLRVDFGRPDGRITGYPVAMILAAKGAARPAVRRVSAADRYSGGVCFVRPA